MRGSSARFISFAIVLIMLLSMVLLSTVGCKKSPLDPKHPVTLTMWHNYGGQMKNLMDEMIDEFNATVGTDNGIIISVTAISGSKELHDMLTAAAEEVPGAMPLPDITTSYPKTAVLLHQYDRLVDLDDYFNRDELDKYVAAFVDEGRIGDEGLYVFPIAKSTEVMFVNQTLFDRFASENDIDYEDLSTFEGIAAASMTYLEWTDNKTPDEPGDGRAFFMADSLFNQALVGSRQLNESFLLFDEEDNENGNVTTQLDFGSPAHSRIWNINYTPSVCGGFAAFDGYSSDLFKTGDLVCSVGSTAGVLYYPDTVTYADNSQEEANYTILPYPTFVDGRKVALQRGGGMCVIKSEEARHYAAALFLDWFTEPEQNLRFTLSSGYLPVTQEAFNSLQDIINPVTAGTSGSSDSAFSIDDPRIRKQMTTVLQMYDEYEFFYMPHAENVENLQRAYEENVLEIIKQDRLAYASEQSDKSKCSSDVASQVKEMSEQSWRMLSEQIDE